MKIKNLSKGTEEIINMCLGVSRLGFQKTRSLKIKY